MEEKTGVKPHSCLMQDRSSVKLTGVREVVSFDDSQVVMDTDMGLLSVKGRELHLKQLSVDGGQVAVDGNVDALLYEENRKEGGFLARLLG